MIANLTRGTWASKLKLNGELAYVATPKLELGAFVKVHLTNSSPDTLLAGDVHVFRDGDLIGKVAMREIVAGAEFDLFCGRDDAIKIDRKELVNRQAQYRAVQPSQAETAEVPNNGSESSENASLDHGLRRHLTGFSGQSDQRRARTNFP